ncbi:MAG: hypothetical protein A2W01_11935 [Candidatus Solincola sediminis]|nr:MAG: hypothetical protein A2W01_11935 [Candidatus Solincola sediminis]
MGPPQAPMRQRPQVDTSRLPIPDIVVAAGALLTFIFAMIGWYKASVDYLGFGASATGSGGWQWLPRLIELLLFLFAGFMIANEMFNLVDLSLPVGTIYLVVGALGTITTLLAILIKPSVGFGVGVKMGMNWPIWIIAIILSLAPIAGGYLKQQQG